MKPQLIALIALIAFFGCALAQQEGEYHATRDSYHDDDDEYDNDLFELDMEEDDAGDTFSTAAFVPSDEDELSLVAEEHKPLFADFCIESRDHFKATMNDKVNEGSAKLFKTIFDNFKGIANEALAAQQEAVIKAIEDLKKGNVGDADANHDGELTKEELADKVGEDAAEKVSVDENGQPIKKGVVKQFTTAVFNVVSTMLSAAYSEAELTLKRIKATIDLNLATESMDVACAMITGELKNEMAKKFEDTKTDLLRAANRQKDKQAQATIDSVTFSTVNCLTTKRVNTVSSWCNTLKGVTPMVGQLFKSLTK